MRNALQAFIIVAAATLSNAEGRQPWWDDSREDVDFERFEWKPQRALPQQQQPQSHHNFWTDHEMPRSVDRFQKHVVYSDPWEPTLMTRLDRNDRWMRLESGTDDEDDLRLESALSLGNRLHRSHYVPAESALLTAAPEVYYVTYKTYNEPEDNSHKRVVMYEEKKWGPPIFDEELHQQEDAYGQDPFHYLAKRNEVADLFNYRLKKRQMISTVKPEPQILVEEVQPTDTVVVEAGAADGVQQEGQSAAKTAVVFDVQEQQSTVSDDCQTTPPVDKASHLTDGKADEEVQSTSPVSEEGTETTATPPTSRLTSTHRLVETHKTGDPVSGN